jgi:biotin carboxyl carrier protein
MLYFPIGKRRERKMAKQDVESEVTGNVWKVLKSVGDSVAEGEVIMILESMKMEIPVESPAAGTLSQVLVEPEEQVEEDQVVAVIVS